MKKIMLTLLLAVMTFTAYADEKKSNEQSFKNFAKRQETAIINEALLSEKQVETFMPIYREYKKKLHELGRQKFELKKNSRDNFGAVLSQLADIEANEAKTKKDFYEKGANAIGAEKVFRVLRAEDRFHHNMLKNGMHHSKAGKTSGHGKGAQHGKGQRDGKAKTAASPESKGCPSQQGKGRSGHGQQPAQPTQQN